MSAEYKNINNTKLDKLYCAIKVVTCDSDKVNLELVRFLRT